MANTSGEEVYLSHSGQEIDDNIDEVIAARGSASSLKAAIDAKQETLTFDTEPTEDSTNPVESGGVFDAIKNLHSLEVGEAIPDKTDPDTGALYADIFELPVGKFRRSTNLSRIRNLPNGFSGGFYCIVENTVTAARKKVTLYPASAPDGGTFYECTEYSTGFGDWYKYTGTVVQ